MGCVRASEFTRACLKCLVSSACATACLPACLLAYPRVDALHHSRGCRLLKCYGSKERALQAIRVNPTVVNPSYSFCNTMLESKRVLLGAMSEAEALEVMARNPSILQCGPSLEPLGASEIKLFASIRGLGNNIPPEVRNASLAAFLALIILPVAIAQNPALTETGMLDTAEAVVGAIGAPLFAGTIGYLLLAGGRS